MSLRTRVALLILTMFVLGMMGGAARIWQDARRQVQTELRASMSLPAELLSLIRGFRTQDFSQPLNGEQLAQLAELKAISRFDIVNSGASDNGSPSPGQTAVPNWFQAAIGIDEALLLKPLGTNSGVPVLIRLDISRAVEEIWRDALESFISRIGALLLMTIVIYLFIGYWLKPIEGIIAGLQEISKGNYASRIPGSGLPELDQINDNINELTGVLAASKQDNERLQAESVSNLERERMRVARELHDSLGQAVSAIKAMAVSIAMRSRERMPEISDSAQHIEKTSDTAYRTVRDLIAWLRPGILDELGLALALQQMVDDWNVHHESIFCRLKISSSLEGLNDEQKINIYRIVQESLTNVARHSQANEVSVETGGDHPLWINIVDNGKGFDPAHVKRGMGLWNIQDRVNLLRGKLKVVTGPGQGVCLHAEFPRNLDHRKLQS